MHVSHNFSSIAWIIIHTFEIISNLILISNPIRAYVYPKYEKIIGKTIKRKPTAAPVWAWDPGPSPGLPRPMGPGGAVGLCFIVFSSGFLHFGYAYALIGLEINIRLDSISNVCIIIPEV